MYECFKFGWRRRRSWWRAEHSLQVHEGAGEFLFYPSSHINLCFFRTKTHLNGNQEWQCLLVTLVRSLDTTTILLRNVLVSEPKYLGGDDFSGLQTWMMRRHLLSLHSASGLFRRVTKEEEQVPPTRSRKYATFSGRIYCFVVSC